MKNIQKENKQDNILKPSLAKKLETRHEATTKRQKNTLKKSNAF